MPWMWDLEIEFNLRLAEMKKSAHGSRNLTLRSLGVTTNWADIMHGTCCCKCHLHSPSLCITYTNNRGTHAFCLTWLHQRIMKKSIIAARTCEDAFMHYVKEDKGCWGHEVSRVNISRFCVYYENNLPWNTFWIKQPPFFGSSKQIVADGITFLLEL